MCLLGWSVCSITYSCQSRLVAVYYVIVPWSAIYMACDALARAIKAGACCKGCGLRIYVKLAGGAHGMSCNYEGLQAAILNN